MKAIKLCSVAVLAAAALTSQAETTYNAAFVSDYVWRGLTQTDNGAALQAGADYTVGNAYAGTWVSNVEEQDGAEGVPAEMDVYFGYNHDFGAISIDTAVTTYNYLNDSTGDLTEFKVGVLPKQIKGLSVALHREVKTKYWYPEVAFETTLPHRLYLDAAAGFWSIDDADDSAFTMRAELARDFPEFHHIDVFGGLSYITDNTPGGNNADDDDAEALFLMGIRKNF